MKRATCSGRAGFTMVELAVATLLLVVLLGSVAIFSDRGVDALGAGTLQSDLDAHLRRAVGRMTDDLLPSGMTVITSVATADALTYRKSAGPRNGTNTWGPTMSLAFVREPGELDDGLDNDSDGLVDEGLVEWRMDVGTPEERVVVLCRGVPELGPGEQENDADDDGDGLVDERGVVFERVGDTTVRVGLTLQRLDQDRRPVTRTLETMLQPRN